MFFPKTALIFLLKTIGQLIRATLNVFNILIHDVYRKIDKKCILENGKFWNFCNFRGRFGALLGLFRHSQKSPKIF